MNIDIENIDQSKNFFNESIFYPMYTCLKDTSTAHPNVYLIAPLVSVTDGFLNLIESICGVSEAIFKGLVNTVGSGVNNNCSCYRGVLQLAGAVAMGVLTPVIIALRMTKITHQFFKNPILCSSVQAQKYNPLLKYS